MKTQLVIFLALIAMFSMAYGQSPSLSAALPSAGSASAGASPALVSASVGASPALVSASAGASPASASAGASPASVSAGASPASASAGASPASVSAGASTAAPSASNAGASPAASTPAVSTAVPSPAASTPVVSTAVPSPAASTPAVSTAVPSPAASTAAASTAAPSGPATVAPGNPANAPTAIVNNPVPTCGNGVLEFNEDCDTGIAGTRCCNQLCKFAQVNTPCTPVISNLNQNTKGANDGQECLATDIWNCHQVAVGAANTTCEIASKSCTLTTKKGKRTIKGFCKTAGPVSNPKYIRCVKKQTFRAAQASAKAAQKAARIASKRAQR